MKHLEEHIVQSDIWANFKNEFGHETLKVADVLIIKHKIPLLPYYVGYAPRVNFLTQNCSWKELKTICRDERIIFVRFDIPNITKDQVSSGRSAKVYEDIVLNCKKSPRSTFAKWNILLNLNRAESEIIESFSQKTRYNVRLASKKGVYTKVENTEAGFKVFINLLKETAKRQKYLIHSESYYKKLFNLLLEQKMVNILNAYYNEQPLASWFLINYRKTFYYPYGGSSELHKNLMASNLIAWDAIALGKSLGCELFDMWGATNDQNSSWWGFTKFKLGYGGELVEYIDSYDFYVNKPISFLFNTAYQAFWNLVGIARRFK